MGLILLACITLVLIAVLPMWRYSRKWGYTPTGGLTLLLLIVAVLVVFRAIPQGF